MNFKIGGTKSVGATTDKKKAKKTGASDGASFANMLDAASGVNKAEPVEAVTSVGGVQSPLYAPLDNEQVPQKSKERGQYLMQRLEELEKDILLGNPTKAIAELKEALAVAAIDRDSLNDKQRQLLDEIDLRASIEVAKLEN